MTTWLTSDLHLGHAKIIELGHRPFASVEEMDAALIERWNSTVRPEDTVWVLGDLALGKTRQTIQQCRQLHGEKHLVPGNHDTLHPMHKRWRREVREYEAVGFTVHSPTVVMPDEFYIAFGQEVRACHFPYQGDHVEEERYPEWRPSDQGAILLHGHVHNAWCVKGRQINVGVDPWRFRPVSLKELVIAYREANS